MALTNTYIPSSMSKSYVENKRTPEGTRGYLQAEQELDIQKQSALQNLEQQYASTIENAYASYLQNQRNIGMSQMGEGYKQLYRQQQEQQLASNIAQTNLSASQARQELGLQTEEAKAQLETVKQTEISNLNRVQNTMQQYLNYVKDLSNETQESILTPEQQGMYIDDLYETLYSGLPLKGFTDKSGNAALSYAEWIRSNLTRSEADTAWGDWLFSGGLQDFMTAVKQTKALETKPKEDLKPYSETQEYTIETAPEGYVAKSNADIQVKHDAMTGSRSTAKAGDEIIVTNLDGTTEKYTVATGLVTDPTMQNARSEIFNDKALNNHKNLAVNDIVVAKDGNYYMFLGYFKDSPKFLKLNKVK